MYIDGSHLVRMYLCKGVILGIKLGLTFPYAAFHSASPADFIALLLVLREYKYLGIAKHSFNNRIDDPFY